MTLIVVSGAPGTGRSTIARELAAALRFCLADRDGRRSTGAAPLPGRPRRWQAIGVPTRLVHLVIDAAEPARLAQFWAAGPGWVVAAEEPDEVDV